MVHDSGFPLSASNGPRDPTRIPCPSNGLEMGPAIIVITLNLAVFVIGVTLIWLPGRLIELLSYVGAGFLSDVLGAGVAGVGFGSIAFGLRPGRGMLVFGG
ncbi:hypothetical protein [Thiorhodovibrio litoralis]|uniref:hypothetical protein n=1 Tax=Thiorhodovibrio litoralis TaxID=2952932 RepID=UPI002B2626EF|nr:hypothetical protein [Thiorhodovibrio litoralis]